MSNFRSNELDVKYCENCQKFHNISNINSIRLHDQICPPSKRMKFFSKKREENTSESRTLMQKYEEEKLKAHELLKQLESDQMDTRPMRSYNAYSSTTSSQRKKSYLFEKQTNEIESQLSSDISSTISTHSPLFSTSAYSRHTRGKSKKIALLLFMTTQLIFLKSIFFS